MKKYNLSELSKFNGLKGKPAYVSFKGIIYDVSQVFQNGEHAGVKAGTDITAAFAKGPHQEDIFKGANVVGELVETNKLAESADLILRLALGIIFFVHGSQKLLGWFGGYGWDGTMGFFTQTLGLPALIGGLTILIEFFGGIAILLGLFSRLAALGLTGVMLGALVKVHLANGFFLKDTPGDGFEYVLVLLAFSIYLVIKGSGEYSLDKRFGIKY